jgi:methyltransferase
VQVLLVSARRSAYSGEAISAPHQGLLSLAATLRAGTFADTSEIEVDVVDDQLIAIDRPLAPPSSCLQSRQPDVVAVQTVTSSLNKGIRLLDEARALVPQALTVFGGVGPTPVGADLVAKGVADVVVRGEAEVSFSLLLEGWRTARRAALPSVPGITFRRDLAIATLVLRSPQPLFTRNVAIPTVADRGESPKWFDPFPYRARATLRTIRECTLQETCQD